MNSGLKSLSQLHKELIEKKNSINKLFDEFDVPNISEEVDYQTKNLTFQKIFNLIPNEQKLKQILDNRTTQYQEQKLENYKGEYEIAQRVAKRVQQLKPQAKKIYYLFHELNLPKINDNFKKIKQTGKLKLSSYEMINKQYQIKEEINKSRSNSKKKCQQKISNSMNKSKCTKFERNTISQDYIYSIKESIKDEQIMPPNHYVKDDDLLINVCIYDSLNRQKQHQFIFLGDMKLTQLKRQIYCLIESLSLEKTDNQESSKKISNIKKELKNEPSFFLFEQNLYYHGTNNSQQEIDNLIKMIKSSYQIDFYKFSMSNIELKHLRVIFGRPYLFRHIGGCDHMIVFKDIKLFSKENGVQPESKKKYPLMIFQSKMKRRKCQGCEGSDNKYAVLACKGDKLKNGKTSYLCRQCHENIHNEMTNPKNKLMVTIPYIHQ